MSPEERQLIVDLFNRIKTNATQPRDKDAEALINQAVQQQPYAPYLLVQSVIVQNQALEAANQKIQQLQAQAQHQAEAPQSGGFLSGIGSLFGNGHAQQQAQPRMAPAAQPQPGYQTPQVAGGGGVLRNALGTAAGVAGGVLLADSISSLFHGNEHGIAGATPASENETVINNYYEDPAAADQNTQQADYSDSDSGDDSFDDGGGIDI